jgi:hypothetical protein
VDLAADAREWARWTVKSDVVLTDPPQVELTLQPATSTDVATIVTGDWIDTEWGDVSTTDDKGRSVRPARLLLQGPDVLDIVGLVLASGVYTTRLRVTETPEVIPRDTGSITVGS